MTGKLHCFYYNHIIWWYFKNTDNYTLPNIWHRRYNQLVTPSNSWLCWRRLVSSTTGAEYSRVDKRKGEREFWFDFEVKVLFDHMIWSMQFNRTQSIWDLQKKDLDIDLKTHLNSKFTLDIELYYSNYILKL